MAVFFYPPRDVCRSCIFPIFSAFHHYWWPLTLLLVKKRFFRISPSLVMCKRNFKMQLRLRYVLFPHSIQKFSLDVMYHTHVFVTFSFKCVFFFLFTYELKKVYICFTQERQKKYKQHTCTKNTRSQNFANSQLKFLHNLNRKAIKTSSRCPKETCYQMNVPWNPIKSPIIHFLN